MNATELPPLYLGPVVALGVGLLIGIERERRKGTGPARAFAGVRSFTVVALMGAMARLTDNLLLVGCGALLVLALISIAYWRDRSQDPGITTELSLFITYLIGVTAVPHPAMAAGAGVVVALLLAARNHLHHFSRNLLSATELRDALLLAGAVLVVLPLLPDRGPAWAPALNPHRIWAMLVLVLAIQGVGHIALRIFGTRSGLALSGLFSGFVSSTATIAAMGTRARADASAINACVAGALLSNVSTVLQLALLALFIDPALLPKIALPLVAAAVAAAAGAAIGLLRRPPHAPDAAAPARSAFNLTHALAFAALMTGVTLAVSLAARFDHALAVEGTLAIAGFADAHATAIAAFSLAVERGSAAPDPALMMLLGLSTNTLSKAVVAWISGGSAYALRLVPALLAMVGCAWGAWLLF